MRILGRQFVMGATIARGAGARARDEERGYRYSYDMLGEAARTAPTPQRYFAPTTAGIEAIGGAATRRRCRPRPRASRSSSRRCIRATSTRKRERVCAELVPRLRALAERAPERGIGLTVDAEEAERLDCRSTCSSACSRSPRWPG